MNTKLEYPMLIQPLSSEEGTGYLAGCMADGETIEEAIKEAQDALKSCVKTAAEFGAPLPRASVSENYSGQWHQRVPKSLHAKLAFQAKQEGVSLNTFVAIWLAEGMERHHHPV